MYHSRKEFDSVIRFNGLWRSFIRNRIHVATCSLAAVWTWSHLTGSKLLMSDLFIVPITMLSIYQWNRVYDLNEDSVNSPNSVYHTSRNRNWIQHFCFISVLTVLIVSIFTGSVRGVLILTFVIFLGVLYSTPVFFFSENRLKNLTIVKNLTSALGWTLLVVFYTPIHAGSTLSSEHWVAAIMMFSAVWMVELIWDIRDLKGDAIMGVQTIPVLLGVEVTRKCVLAINFCSAVILIGSIVNGLISTLWFFLLLNHLMVNIWVLNDDEMLLNRERSHLLVGLQTLLLFSLGFFAVYLT